MRNSVRYRPVSLRHNGSLPLRGCLAGVSATALIVSPPRPEKQEPAKSDSAHLRPAGCGILKRVQSFVERCTVRYCWNATGLPGGSLRSSLQRADIEATWNATGLPGGSLRSSLQRTSIEAAWNATGLPGGSLRSSLHWTGIEVA